MVEVMTPEDLLGIERPKVMVHHGTCDLCRERLILVVHLGYDTQPERDFRICKKCYEKYKEAFEY